METTELRIGNLVNKGKVKSIYYDGTVGLDDGYSWNTDLVQPIPITEEWLLRFGFEIRDGKFYLLKFLIEKGISQYFDNGLSFRITTSNSESTHAASVKYVHQLQNVFFALTGEELELNNKWLEKWKESIGFKPSEKTPQLEVSNYEIEKMKYRPPSPNELKKKYYHAEWIKENFDARSGKPRPDAISEQEWLLNRGFIIEDGELKEI